MAPVAVRKSLVPQDADQDIAPNEMAQALKQAQFKYQARARDLEVKYLAESRALRSEFLAEVASINEVAG